MSAELPKLLVLGKVLPGSRDGGGVVQAAVLRHYPKNRYVCFATHGPALSGLGDETAVSATEQIPCLVRPVRPRLPIRGSRHFSTLIGLRCIAPLRVRQLVAFGRRHGVELVWAVLYGDAVVLAKKVADGLGVPFVGTVWDDPEAWLQDEGYDSISRRFLWRRFREALASARCVSTAGEAMQREYLREYRVNSVILRHGFERPALPRETRGDNGQIVIGFVGSAYGRDAWTTFLKAIARLNTTGKLPHIRVRTFGGGEFPYRYDGVEVESRGWQAADVMLREIAETDFCYLPYWFEPAKRRHVELSFPNKFETYMAAGRPVLYHGPEYAGIAKTIRDHAVGSCVHSLNGDVVSATLAEFITDSSLRASYSRAALAAFHSEFNATVMMRNFARLLGLAESALLNRDR